MAVVTNSISCVGCTLSLVLGTANRSLSLRELHLLTRQDYPSMVLVVFNKYLHPHSRLIQVSRFDTSNTNSLPSRTSRLPRRMGTRRLLLPPLPLRLKSTPPPPSHPSQIHPRLRNSRLLLPKVHVPRLHIPNQLCQNRGFKMAQSHARRHLWRQILDQSP